MNKKKRNMFIIGIVLIIVIFIYVEFFIGAKNTRRKLYSTKMTQDQILAECPELEFTDEIMAWMHDVTEKAVEKKIDDVKIMIKENSGKEFYFQRYIPEIINTPEELGVSTDLFPDASKCEIKTYFKDCSEEDGGIFISCTATVEYNDLNNRKYRVYTIQGKYGDSYDKYSKYSQVETYRNDSEQFSLPESKYSADFETEKYIKSVSGHKWFALPRGIFDALRYY